MNNTTLSGYKFLMVVQMVGYDMVLRMPVIDFQTLIWQEIAEIARVTTPGVFKKIGKI